MPLVSVGGTSVLGEAKRGDGLRYWQAELVGGLPGGQEHQDEQEPGAVLPVAVGESGVGLGQTVF